MVLQAVHVTKKKTQDVLVEDVEKLSLYRKLQESRVSTLLIITVAPNTSSGPRADEQMNKGNTYIGPSQILQTQVAKIYASFLSFIL